MVSFVAGGLFRLTYQLDSDKQVLEGFLWESAYLKFVIGELEKIQIRRMVNFYGSEDERPYKDYLYYLKGSKKGTYVRVRHYYDCKFEVDECTSILSID